MEEALRDGRINIGVQGDSDDDDGDDGDDEGRPGKSGQENKAGVKVVTARRFEREVGLLRDEVQTMRAQQDYMIDKMRRDMGSMKSLLKRLLLLQMGGDSDTHGETCSSVLLLHNLYSLLWSSPFNHFSAKALFLNQRAA